MVVAVVVVMAEQASNDIEWPKGWAKKKGDKIAEIYIQMYVYVYEVMRWLENEIESITCICVVNVWAAL